MKIIILFLLLPITSLVHSQKHSVDLSLLISHYSDIGGQNAELPGNNILFYTSYGSLDYRLSYFYNNKRSNLFAIELEASRRTMPTTGSASTQYLIESFGIGLVGGGKVFKLEDLQLRVVTGFSFLLDTIHEYVEERNQDFKFFTSGLSFGSDVVYNVHRREPKYLKNWYAKVGFRGSLQVIHVNLKGDNIGSPHNAIGSILVGTGYSF